MVSEAHIREVAGRLGMALHARQVILFGSYARGEATDRSDVDLLIVAESNLPRHRRSVELYRQLRPYPFRMDLIVYTPEEMEEATRTPLSFVSAVLREGKTLYDCRDGSRQAMVG